LYPEDASVFLLEASDGLHLVDRDVVEITMVESVDGSRRLGSLDWHPSPATAMSGGVAAAERARDRAAVAAAAELLGLSDAMLELTVGYVTERKQFGVAIGTFQALKHQLADALVELEFAKPLVWRAAVSLAENDPLASLHASMAKAAASDAADHVGRVALQCHGAIAYTVEYDLHLYLKRSWALRAQDGSSALHRRRVADALLG
jgi:alkylation response protein AidB-like acyl-CoA dehydrogenase